MVLLQVELKEPFVLHLQKCNIEERKKWEPKFDDILECYSENRAVSFFLPIKPNSLYTWLLRVNNAQVCQEIRLVIDQTAN